MSQSEAFCDYRYVVSFIVTLISVLFWNVSRKIPSCPKMMSYSETFTPNDLSSWARYPFDHACQTQSPNHASDGLVMNVPQAFLKCISAWEKYLSLHACQTHLPMWATKTHYASEGHVIHNLFGKGSFVLLPFSIVSLLERSIPLATSTCSSMSTAKNRRHCLVDACSSLNTS